MKQTTDTKNTARRRFFFLFAGTCAGMIVLCLIALNLLLEPYYRREKEQAMRSTCGLLDEIARTGGFDDSNAM